MKTIKKCPLISMARMRGRSSDMSFFSFTLGALYVQINSVSFLFSRRSRSTTASSGFPLHPHYIYLFAWCQWDCLIKFRQLVGWVQIWTLFYLSSEGSCGPSGVPAGGVVSVLSLGGWGVCGVVVRWYRGISVKSCA